MIDCSFKAMLIPPRAAENREPMFEVTLDTVDDVTVAKVVFTTSFSSGGNVPSATGGRSGSAGSIGSVGSIGPVGRSVTVTATSSAAAAIPVTECEMVTRSLTVSSSAAAVTVKVCGVSQLFESNVSWGGEIVISDPPLGVTVTVPSGLLDSRTV